MPDMKLILERWDSYLIFEEDTLSQLKDDAVAVEELADDVARIKDRKRLQAILSALAADPEILQVVNALKELAQEVDDAPADVEEGLSDDFLKLSTQGYLGAQNLLNTEAARKIMKVAPPLLALGLIAFKLTSGGGMDADDGGMLSTILKATGKTDFESVLGVMGAGAEGAVTEKKWNY
jgi:hypothetical protein